MTQPERLIPVWHTPLRLQWPYARAREGYETAAVFTTTLVLPAIAIAFAPLRPTVEPSGDAESLEAWRRRRVEAALSRARRLVAHVGYFDLEHLACAVDHRTTSKQVFGKPILGRTPLPPALPPEPVPPEQLRVFVSTYGSALGALAQRLAPLAAAVEEAADRGARVLPGHAPVAADLWNAHPPTTGLRLVRVAAGRRWRRGWAHEPASLRDRIVLEAEQLAFERPRMHRCDICGRAFVPFAREAHCRGHLWSWPAGPLRAICRRDIPFTAGRRARRARTDHDRYRDRTYQQLRRFRRDLERTTDPRERENLQKMIDELEEKRGPQLKRRGPSTTRPVVIHDTEKGD